MAGPKRKIYRGGYQENHPEQMEYLLDSSGTLPGHLLAVNSDEEFALHGTEGYLYIANAPPCMDPLTYEYEVGETAFGYVPRSRDVYLMRAAAGLTFDKDAPLYSNQAGQVTTSSAGGNVLVGYAHFAQATATAANDLIDVRVK
jgi:hypothetical protein